MAALAMMEAMFRGGEDVVWREGCGTVTVTAAVGVRA